ncbi:hypothetical protein LTR36_005448 [Oleoguttula mirabilis]|uniref:Uncharacterized protein n=1 Tax=Oleoguttula mirabilis TaxID=1507867 RepID=A0AAV9JF71_9PEZI|nr:hypothetical protein LTR36_005448 [Oleoguttula mirabilis]
MTSPTVSGGDLCPLDTRRTSAELVVKLFIVHFTTLSAYCHLLSIRGEPVVSWKLAFYFLEPFSAFGYYAISTIIVAAAAGLYLTQPDQRHKEVKLSVASILLGSIPEQDEQTLPQVASGHASSSRLHADRYGIQSKWKKAGRMLLATALLAQCLCTMVLYNRRRAHDALTFADERVLALACSSILTALIWLAVLIRLPAFSTETSLGFLGPDGSRDNPKPHRLETAAAVLRVCLCANPPGQQETKKGDKWIVTAVSFLTNGAIAFLSLLARGRLATFGAFLARVLEQLLQPGASGASTASMLQDIAALGVVIVFLGAVAAAVSSNGNCCGMFLLGFPS